MQVGKSGNLLRFGQPDFLSSCSLLRRLTARGPRDERRNEWSMVVQHSAIGCRVGANLVFARHGVYMTNLMVNCHAGHMV
ncbi:hypothetical protein CLI85_13145 [Tannerella forsythia]|nr:hypothetical protein CLI85_13145 [Tannerella forsythia]